MQAVDRLGQAFEIEVGPDSLELGELLHAVVRVQSIGNQGRQRDGCHGCFAQLGMRQNPQAGVMVQHAADDFVGQVPLKGETGSRHRVVPIELRLLELGQGVWSGAPQAHELEVRVEEFVGQKRQQKILQQAAGECRVDVGRKQPGDFAGKDARCRQTFQNEF